MYSLSPYLALTLLVAPLLSSCTPPPTERTSTVAAAASRKSQLFWDTVYSPTAEADLKLALAPREGQLLLVDMPERAGLARVWQRWSFSRAHPPASSAVVNTALDGACALGDSIPPSLPDELRAVCKRLVTVAAGTERADQAVLHWTPLATLGLRLAAHPTIDGHEVKLDVFSPHGRPRPVLSKAAITTSSTRELVSSFNRLTVELTPDERVALGWLNTTTLAFFDVRSQRVLGKLAPDHGHLCCVSFSPDGRHVAVMKRDHTSLVEVPTGKEVGRWNIYAQGAAWTSPENVLVLGKNAELYGGRLDDLRPKRIASTGLDRVTGMALVAGGNPGSDVAAVLGFWDAHEGMALIRLADGARLYVTIVQPSHQKERSVIWFTEHGSYDCSSQASCKISGLLQRNVRAVARSPDLWKRFFAGAPFRRRAGPFDPTSLIPSLACIAEGTYPVCMASSPSVLKADGAKASARDLETAVSEVYPSEHVLPAYMGPKFRWVENTCGQLVDGRVLCWSHGHDRKIVEHSTFRDLHPGSMLPQCKLSRAGEATCLGSSAAAGMGPDCPDAAGCPSYDVVTLPERARQIVGRGTRRCALTTNGNVYCWGADYLEDWCKSDEAARDARCAEPARVLIRNARELVMDRSAVCAVTTAGDVYCSGFGPRATPETLASGDLVPDPRVVKVSGLQAVEQLWFLSGMFACIRATSGDVSCWGKNDAGVLGEPGLTYSPVPRKLPGLANIKQIAAAGANLCALRADGSVACWGDMIARLSPQVRELGHRPVDVPGIRGAVEVAVNAAGTGCARLSGGEVYCWGARSRDEFGVGGERSYGPPLPLKLPNETRTP